MDTHNMAAILAGGTHITSDLGTGILKTRGYPNHCDNGLAAVSVLYSNVLSMKSILSLMVSNWTLTSSGVYFSEYCSSNK